MAGWVSGQAMPALVTREADVIAMLQREGAA
jgi:hypothetical protein